MLFLKEGNLKNDNLLFQVKVMFFTAQLILQPTPGNTLPPPVLEIHLILLSLRAEFNLKSFCFCNGNMKYKAECFTVEKETGKAVYLVKSTTTRKRG